ncbi:hypothetical protein, partial [Paenibacillus aceti]|uniref:hypothetical protein n=1 Tax=Paenibacillus aceti TaxID=1820010 RepID=UPI001E5E7629
LHPHSGWFFVSRVSRTQLAKAIIKKAPHPQGTSTLVVPPKIQSAIREILSCPVTGTPGNPYTHHLHFAQA